LKVHACELAYGERPFEVTTPDDLQLRTRHELWRKENLINPCVRRFPAGCQYGATTDCDFHMTQMGWPKKPSINFSAIRSCNSTRT
jgi:hypothetical protein